MKAIGDPMEISEEVLGNPTGDPCYVCDIGGYIGDFIHCANCKSCAHASCVRATNWCGCHQEEEEENAVEEEAEKEEEALSGETYKYTVDLTPYGCGVFQSVRPLGNRVLVKTKSSADESRGDTFHCLEIGQIVDVSKSCSSFQAGEEIVFYREAGMKVLLNEQEYILLGEDDVLGFFELFDIKDVENLKPVGDRVLIQVAEVENQKADVIDPSPAMGRVISAGPDASDIKPPRSVLYLKLAGHEVNSSSGRKYAIVRKSDVVALLS